MCAALDCEDNLKVLPYFAAVAAIVAPGMDMLMVAAIVAPIAGAALGTSVNLPSLTWKI